MIHHCRKKTMITIKAPSASRLSGTPVMIYSILLKVYGLPAASDISLPAFGSDLEFGRITLGCRYFIELPKEYIIGLRATTGLIIPIRDQTSSPSASDSSTAETIRFAVISIPNWARKMTTMTPLAVWDTMFSPLNCVRGSTGILQQLFILMPVMYRPTGRYWKKFLALQQPFRADG